LRLGSSFAPPEAAQQVIAAEKNCTKKSLDAPDVGVIIHE
jgi:hypothetical protein